MAKCNLGKVKFKTMPVSSRPTLRLRGHLLSSLLGVPHDLHCICLLTCWPVSKVILFAYFQAFFPSPPSLWQVSGLVSIPLIGFSVTVPLVVAARRVAMDTSFLVPRLLPGSTNLFRHQLPSSSTVDEFNVVK